MMTVALRFSDNFAPVSGTIEEHIKIIEKLSYVWYGKMGTPLAQNIIRELMGNEEKRILLIHSGRQDRYWAYYTHIQREIPESEGIPEYYRFKTENFRTWFKIIAFEKAPRDILGKCFVRSSGVPLSSVSRHSMSPYFIIETEEE